jgi:hypothetical protein
MLKGAGAIGTAAVLPTVAQAKRARLAVYDSRLPEAQAFAINARQSGSQVIDIASGDCALWQLARTELDAPGSIIGLTGWSDWVVLRGLMEERGKRLVLETRIAHPGKRVATPFQWEMA